jgi:hypothetical protein
MSVGLLDLSVVTDQLRNHLSACAAVFQPWRDDPTTRFNIDFTGLAPDAARSTSGSGCHVSVYLFHAVSDKFYRNTYPTGGPAQRTKQQPFALKLYYLLTAYSATSYIQEQQAMSIVLKCFHEWPLVALPTHEVTLTIEPQTPDEVGRLWQALASPIRLSAVYCVSVVFLQSPDRAVVKPVLHEPEFVPPHDIRPFDSAPGGSGAAFAANAGGRATITIAGPELATGITEVDLRALSLAETTTSPPAPGTFRIVDLHTLDVQVPPTSPAGRYRIEVRIRNRGRVEVWLDVPRPLVATSTGGVATIEIAGAGFGTTTAVFLGTTALTSTASGPPAPGEFHVIDPDSLELAVPAGTPAGRHLVHLQPGTTPRLEAWVEV